EPSIVDRSTPFSLAIRRATGEALTLPLSPDSALSRSAPLSPPESSDPSPAGGAVAGVPRGAEAACPPSTVGDAAATGPAAEASEPSEEPPTRAIGVPIGSVSPSWARISVSVPATSLSYAMFALSVSISTISSPTPISSPTFRIQARIVPSSIESDKRGITMSAISGPSCVTPRAGGAGAGVPRGAEARSAEHRGGCRRDRTRAPGPLERPLQGGQCRRHHVLLVWNRRLL